MSGAQCRHGDVLIVAAAAIPAEVSPVAREDGVLVLVPQPGDAAARVCT